MKLTIAAIAMGAALAACGGDDGGAAPPADGGVDAPGGTAREVIGSIEVYEENHVWVEDGPPMSNRSASVRASFYDGQPPSFHHEVARVGACVLRRYTPSLCDPPCSNGLCVATDVCEPWPSLVAAGRLSIDGLTVAVRLDGADGFYYPQAQLPADLFADTATVRADLAGGGSYPPLALTAGGVPAIAGAIPDGKLTLPPGEDATIRWTPAGGAGGSGARMRLTLNANNQGHGQPYLAILECDVADADGQVTVDASLIDAFPDTRAWNICAGSDCPPSTLRRYHRATAPLGDQDVELLVSSIVSFGVDHILPPPP
ncbi:MAG TPA: hypothetical protein VHE35_27655 [Kofleriaceae bacterium]|nr:hypothetical protein [Kofleriaceae bacterium]